MKFVFLSFILFGCTATSNDEGEMSTLQICVLASCVIESDDIGQDMTEQKNSQKKTNIKKSDEQRAAPKNKVTIE